MRKKTTKSQISILALVVSIAVLAVFICAGCIENEESEEKILRIVSYVGPDTGGSLDPAYKWEGWYVRQAGIYESLFYFDPEMKLQPELATGYTQLNDTAWEVFLREDVLFHDGTKMNSDAAIYSISRVLDPSNTRYEEYSFIDSVYKTGEYTIVIKTKEPYAPTIYAFADPVMSIVSPSAENLGSEPVGTGPYMFSSFEAGTSLDLLANPNYWKEKPKLDGISIIYNNDAATRSLLLLAGDVDISWNFQHSDFSTLSADPNIQSISPKAGIRTDFLYVNGNKAPFNDSRVRQALSYALDRQEIVDTAFEGIGGVPAVGIFSSAIPWSAYDELTSYDNNSKKALELFSEAGITPRSDGKLYYNGEPFSIEILITTKRPSYLPTAEVLATQLEALGITTTTTIIDSSAYSGECKSGNYDLSLSSWITAPGGDPDYFLSLQYLSNGSYAAWTGYSNPRVDELILEGRTTFNETERYAIYGEVQTIIQDEMPLIPINYVTNIFALDKSVTGFEIYPNELTVVTSKLDLE